MAGIYNIHQMDPACLARLVGQVLSSLLI